MLSFLSRHSCVWTSRRQRQKTWPLAAGIASVTSDPGHAGKSACYHATGAVGFVSGWERWRGRRQLCASQEQHSWKQARAAKGSQGGGHREGRVGGGHLWGQAPTPHSSQFMEFVCQECFCQENFVFSSGNWGKLIFPQQLTEQLLSTSHQDLHSLAKDWKSL